VSRRWIDTLAAVDPSQLAVDDGGERLTHGELQRQARQHATSLYERFGCGQMLIVPATSTTAFVRTLLAVMWSGNVPVPIDPGLPASGRDYISEKSGAAGVLEPLAVPPQGLDETDRYDAAQPAMVIFTSGTSGFPKGVVMSDANLEHSCRTIAAYLDYASHPSAAVALPLFYSYALISQVLCQLSIGGRVRLFAELRNPLKFAGVVEAERLETFCGVPTTFHALCSFHALRPLSMPSVRVLCSAGAAMDDSLLETVRAIFPRARFFNNYGMTEATPRIAFIRDDDPRFGEATCGRPIEAVDVRVIDPASGREMPEREPGMLVVRGPNVTSGYLNEPDQTAASFTRDGFLKSGDMAYLDDGYIFIIGRYDDVFNAGGEKIAPLEIERALNSCPGVEASAVSGIHDAQRGMVPVAFLKAADNLTREQIVAHLRTRLSKSKVPLRFLRVSGFPTTPNGKVQRRRLSPDDATYVLNELR
jgi:acyl-CoA synthetase (AMP-forming)/AMP-acid ligase II